MPINCKSLFLLDGYFLDYFSKPSVMGKFSELFFMDTVFFSCIDFCEFSAKRLKRKKRHVEETGCFDDL